MKMLQSLEDTMRQSVSSMERKLSRNCSPYHTEIYCSQVYSTVHYTNKMTRDEMRSYWNFNSIEVLSPTPKLACSSSASFQALQVALDLSNFASQQSLRHISSLTISHLAGHSQGAAIPMALVHQAPRELVGDACSTPEAL